VLRYIAYERGIGGPKMVHAACWAHPRRRFVDAVKLNRQDAASIRAVKLMDELFAIDREAREAQMDHAARHRLRREKAPPLLDQIRIHILATSKTVLPKSAVGIACSYTLALWKKLACFLDHPQLKLSNNLAENSMHPVAIGRKNLMHIGSEQAGPRVAAILSVVAAAGSRSRCATTSAPSSRSSPTRPSSASPNSPPQLGSTRGHS
jgi:transposase